MRIIQITDLHIGEIYEDTFGVDVRKNFVTILEKAQQSAPDHIVITGDLCFQSGDMEIYNWIHDRLESIQIPYSIIAGNHDDSKMLADVFGLRHLMEGEDLFYKLKLNGQDLEIELNGKLEMANKERKDMKNLSLVCCYLSKD